MQTETLRTEYFTSCSQNVHFRDTKAQLDKWNDACILLCLSQLAESIMRGEHQVGFVTSIEIKRNIFNLWFQGANPVCADICAVCGDRATKYRYSHYGNFHDLLIIIFVKYHSNHSIALQGQLVAFLVERSTEEVWWRCRKLILLFDGNKCLVC